MFEQERHYSPYIDGEQWTDDVTRSIIDPGTGEQIATVAVSSAETVNEAVSVAEERLDEWASFDPSERGRVLTKTARLLKERQDELVAAGTLESGKPRGEASFDVDATAGFLRYYGGLADKVEGSEIPVPGERLSVASTLNVPAYLH